MRNLEERCAELCQWCAGRGLPSVDCHPTHWGKGRWLHMDRDKRLGYPVHRECRASALRAAEGDK